MKTKLEPITGIPVASQQLKVSPPSASVGQETATPLTATNEEISTISQFRQILPYCTIHVQDARPVSERQNYTDVSQVPKYEMSTQAYAERSDTVLRWKQDQALGRFDPIRETRLQDQQERIEDEMTAEANVRHIAVGARCRVGQNADRRGVVGYVGPVPSLPGVGLWVGVCFDEPVGKNDGRHGGKKYFTADAKHGSFVRADKVEIGDYPVKDDLMDDLDEV